MSENQRIRRSLRLCMAACGISLVGWAAEYLGMSWGLPWILAGLAALGWFVVDAARILRGD